MVELLRALTLESTFNGCDFAAGHQHSNDQMQTTHNEHSGQIIRIDSIYKWCSFALHSIGKYCHLFKYWKTQWIIVWCIVIYCCRRIGFYSFAAQQKRILQKVWLRLCVHGTMMMMLMMMILKIASQPRWWTIRCTLWHFIHISQLNGILVQCISLKIHHNTGD